MNYYGGYQPQYGGGYQPQQQYGNPRMDFLQQTQQSMQPMPQMNTGELQGRIVTGREEAVAAQVMPNGVPYFFLDLAHGKAYVKRYDPQAGAVEFIDLAVLRPEAAAQPQYATVDMLNELRAEMEQFRAGMSGPPARRQKGADAE